MPDSTTPIPVLHLAHPPRAVAAVAPQALGTTPLQRDQEQAEGLPLALEREWEDVKSVRRALESALERCQTLQAELLRQSEAQLVELALDVAAKVLMQEVRAGRHEIDPIVKEALARVPPRRGALVRMNPADLERCSLAKDACESKDAEAGVRFVADPSVPRSGCVVESPEGVVRTDLASHLQAIAQVLREGA
jgi:flagellar assembly protein FliH